MLKPFRLLCFADQFGQMAKKFGPSARILVRAANDARTMGWYPGASNCRPIAAEA
jgi:hypothetical protein